jgi:primosomal protein N' (replication factor Y)
MPAEATTPAAYAAVAVPLPLEAPLVYTVPQSLIQRVARGVRVRVRVGRRSLLGVVVDLPDSPPEGVKLRDIDRVVDEQPVLPTELLDLAAFTAEYYLAPLGEVLQAMLPAGLEPWGERRVWLTDAGALAALTDELEQRIVEVLRAAGRVPLADLVEAVSHPEAPEAVRRMEAKGRVVVAEQGRRGVRYLAALELSSGTREQLLDRCGRSQPAREVVEYLTGLGRPATVREVTSVVACGPGVVRRLAKLGVVRGFTQIERLDLGRERLGGREAASFTLRQDQEEALGELESALEAGVFNAFLLTGLTGSGKTEVYLRAAERVLGSGGGAILLVPEIALVPALARSLEQRFGQRAAILHSGLGGSERRQEWERIRAGEARLVLGPRSAVFAPVPDLRLIAVDEEQDTAYKQDTTPRYNGRDMALVRAQRSGAVAVLVSATPSLESRYNVERGKAHSLRLTQRVGVGALPEGVLVDLREEKLPRRRGEVWFSERLRGEIESALAGGDQAILLRNRRGYSPILLCRACGEDMRCEACGLPRTFHRKARELMCHYCGSRRGEPSRCPSCNAEETLEPVGAGTERVEEQFREIFPGVAVETLDRDAARRPGSAAAILERFRRGETRVLIGTQMVSKGHHFPQVALTGVLQADTYLRFPDFRAVERTYNLLVQLAGRAGRGERPGKVVIQTYHPDHYAIRAALAHDDAAFVEEEMRFRRIFHYPPYSRMVQILVRNRNRGKAEEESARLAAALSRHVTGGKVRLLGPAPAPFERLRDHWRFQILLRGPSGSRLRSTVRQALAEAAPRDCVVDVDPYELL